MSSSGTSRRALLGAAAVLPLAAVPAIAEGDQRLPVLRHVDFNRYGTAASAAAHPDAALIRVCEQHILNVNAYNTSTSTLEPEDDPAWLAYEHTRDTISEAEPQTVVGLLAKARAAKVEARNPDGTEDPAGCPAEDWAWDIVNDLLRLTGSAGA